MVKSIIAVIEADKNFDELGKDITDETKYRKQTRLSLGRLKLIKPVVLINPQFV